MRESQGGPSRFLYPALEKGHHPLSISKEPEFVVCWNQLSQHKIRLEVGEMLEK